MPEKLITIRDVCVRYGVSDSLVRRKIRNGDLVAYRCGERLIKLDADQVEAALIRPANETDVEATIARIVAAAPAFTDEQRATISALLRTGGTS